MDDGDEGAVYIDSSRVHRWVRNVWVGFVALALAMSASFYVAVNEHDQRIKDAQNLVRVNQQLIERGRRQAISEAIASERADCVRTRLWRKIALRNGYFQTRRGRADLVFYVRHASRFGCTLR